jgi:hypothetical protein
MPIGGSCNSLTFGGLVSGTIAATQGFLEKIGIHVNKHKHINPILGQ